MAERSSGDGVVAFLLGGVVGAAVALLLAPCSGDETRKRLSSWLEEERRKAKDFLERERNGILERARRRDADAAPRSDEA